MSNNELKHHGILGMHWGQRNGPPYPLSSVQKSAEEKRKNRKAWNSSKKEDHDRARSKKDIDSMSDKELRERVNRLNMEKQYRDLTKNDFERGQDKVKTLLAGAAGGVLVSGLTSFAIKEAIKRVSKGTISL